MATNDQINNIIQTHLNNGAAQGWGHDDPRVLAAINQSFQDSGVSNQQAADAWGHGFTADSVGQLLGNGAGYASAPSAQSAPFAQAASSAQAAPVAPNTFGAAQYEDGLSYGERLHRQETDRLVRQQLQFAEERGWGGYDDPRTLKHINAALYGMGMTNQDIANAFGVNAVDVDNLFTNAGIDRSGVTTAMRAQDPSTLPPSPFAIGGSAKGGAGGAGTGSFGSGTSGSATGTGGGSIAGGGSTAGGGLFGSVTPDQREVDPSTMTMEGRIGNLLAVDQYGNFTNDVVKQAAERAMAQFASRGLLNSSMAQQAAQQAAISKAIEIAGPDAQTYFAQQGKNQDAVNVFRRAEQDNIYDTAKLNKQLELQWAQLNQQDKQYYAGLQSRMDELRLSNENQTLATQVALQNDLARQNNGAVQSQYDLFVRRLAQIDADTNLDAAAKAKQKQEAAANFQQIASYYGVMNNFDLNFGTQEPQP